MNAMNRLNIGRVESAIAARPGFVLSDAEILSSVPSVFATEAHESRSARFAPIATIDVLNGLRKEGFEAVQAAQSRTRDASRREFTKHMLRLRHQSSKIENVGDESFEIVLINANDGTSAYKMVPGVFRLVCLNGLMVGEGYDEVKVRHSGNAIADVIEGAYRVLGEAPRVTEQIGEFKGITLNRDERAAFAEAAHILRFPNQEERAAPVAAGRLLEPRRSADVTSTLWNTFNVAQENIIRGGQRGRVYDDNGRSRRASSRAVNGIDQASALNRALWTLTERMAQIRQAA